MQKDESSRFLHTFKGMSATLGANQLYQALKQYENEQTASHEEAAEAALQAFLAFINFKNDVKESPEEVNKKPLNKQAQSMLIEALKEALHSHKPQKIKPLMQEMGSVELSENYAVLLPKLQQLVASYQFYEARELLNNG